jgi:glutathione peroxidase-family protein
VRFREVVRITKTELNDLTLKTYLGEIYDYENFKGKVLVVNFWSSIIEDSKNQNEILERVWQEKKDEDFLILGVNFMDTETDAMTHLDKNGITYPTGPDIDSSFDDLFKITEIPETFVISKKGNLIEIFTYLVSYEDLTEIIEDELNK